jgi:hypothetical protein
MGVKEYKLSSHKQIELTRARMDAQNLDDHHRNGMVELGGLGLQGNSGWVTANS